MIVESINLRRPRIKQEVESFLAANDLRLEPLEKAFGLRDNNQRLVGFGGRDGDVLKCFAFDAEYRGQALTDRLISELITDAFYAGHEQLFIFTKTGYTELFESFHFEPVAHTAVVSLLQRGGPSPEQALEKLWSDPDLSGQIGALVMNANPFTLGHQALAEYAAQRVDQLLIFVVEHDASRFRFVDRLRLVKAGTKHLSNVSVLPSTRYMVSAATFPSYFLKDEQTGDQEHAALDATIFKGYFVPYFGIERRFLGQEPRDQTTAYYNQALQAILPPECEVEIIPRRETTQGDIISASVVREKLESKDWETIATMVPPTTLEYLKAEHG